MKFRKTLSAALAMATLFSSVSIVSYAEEDPAMKQALTYVKQRIEIPEELEKFEHRSGVSNNRNYYNFTWTNEGGDSYSDMSVRICGQVITSYSHTDSKADDYEVGNYSFGKLTQEEILEKAREWVKKLNPTVYKNIEILDDTLNVSVSSNRARVNIRRVKNGLPVNGQTGSVVIDKNTGRLISFRISWTMGATFAKPEKAVSVETAIEGFKLDIPVKLEYVTEYDYQTNVYTPHLIYKQTAYGQIDALTGRRSTFEESYGYYDEEAEVEDDVAMDDANPGAGGAINFTPAEKEKMELESTLIKADEAVKSLYDMGIFSMGANPEVDHSEINFDERLGVYTRYVSFSSDDKNYYPVEEPLPVYEEEMLPEDDDAPAEETQLSIHGDFTINAETGDVLGFYSWRSGGKSDNKLLTEENSLDIMNKYIDILAGDKAKEFSLANPWYSYSSYDKNGKPSKSAYITNASASSPRYVYDIPAPAEDISIEINSDKRITSYNISYCGIEYPEPVNIISAEEAYNRFFEQTDFYLQYRLAIKEKKTLSAMVYNTDDTLLIDAYTGKRTTYNGAEIFETYKGGYTDLEGSEYREIAEKLAMYNITLMDEDGRLRPDEYITRNDFAQLSREIGCYYYDSQSGDKPLTRQFAAKILTNNIISEECAELPGIFKSPFSDVSENNKYVGYIAIANAKGIMEGKDGKFRPSAKIKRGEALQLIYNYLA